MKKIIAYFCRIFCKPKTENNMNAFFNVGQPFKKYQIREFVENFKRLVKSNDLAKAFNREDGIREAEFFGTGKIMKLLDSKITGKEVLGIRIYYGIKDGEPRLFLIPVDANGKDIEFDTTGLKGGGDGDGLGDGAPQPPFNNP